MYSMTPAGKKIWKKNKAVFNSTVIDLSLSNTEAWSIIYEMVTGFLMPQIIPGLTVPEKNQEHENHVIYTLGWSVQ